MTDETNDLFLDDSDPVVVVLSDARGKTACGVVEAAVDQFEDGVVTIMQLGNVKDLNTVKSFLDNNLNEGDSVAVFHTIVDRNLRRDIRRELDSRGIPSIDLLGPAITVISTLTNEEPVLKPGRRVRKLEEE